MVFYSLVFAWVFFIGVSTALFAFAHLQVDVHSDYVMYTFHILKFNLTDRLFLQYYNGCVFLIATGRPVEKDSMHHANIAC